MIIPLLQYLPIVHARIHRFSKFLVLSRIVRLAHTQYALILTHTNYGVYFHRFEILPTILSATVSTLDSRCNYALYATSCIQSFVHV